jgi:hypothetical protein
LDSNPSGALRLTIGRGAKHDVDALIGGSSAHVQLVVEPLRAGAPLAVHIACVHIQPVQAGAVRARGAIESTAQILNHECDTGSGRHFNRALLYSLTRRSGVGGGF